MNKITLFISAVLILFLSCSMNDKNYEINPKTNTKIQKISDSLFIGCPKIADKEFIENIQNGGFEYFDKYEWILQKTNSKYLQFQQKTIIKEEKVGSVVLKLVKISLIKNNIQIELKVYKNNINTSSILFYKFMYDRNVPDNEQRLECLSYINDNLYLWHLETYTNHSENALGIDNWDKYKIDTVTGKIILIEKLNP